MDAPPDVIKHIYEVVNEASIFVFWKKPLAVTVLAVSCSGLVTLGRFALRIFKSTTSSKICVDFRGVL